MYYDPQAKEVTVEPWRDILRRAACFLEEHGWCRRVMRDENDAACLVGAVRAVEGARRPSWDEYRAYDELCARIKTKRSACDSSSSWDAVIAWNDAPERTFEDVRRLLRDTIEG